MPSLARIEEYYIADDHNASIHTILHITEPKNTRPEAGGHFIALAQVTDKSPEDITQLQLIMQAIEEKHYTKDPPPLQTILREINDQIGENNEALPDDIHFFVGILNNNQFSFAFRGNPIVRLFYKESHVLTEVDLHSSYQDSKKSGQKFFSSVIEGPVNDGDYLFIASPATLEHVPIMEIRNHVDLYGSGETIKMIRRTLRPHAQNASFGGLFIHVPKVHIPKKIVSKNNADDSVLTLVNKVQSTTETLSPSLLGHLVNKIKTKIHEKNLPISDKEIPKNFKTAPAEVDEIDESTLEMLLDETITAKINTGSSEVLVDIDPSEEKLIQETQTLPTYIKNKAEIEEEHTALVTIGKTIVGFFVTIYQLFKRIIFGVIHVFTTVFDVIVNRQERRKELFSIWQEKPKRFVTSVKKLPVFSKILLSLIIVACIVFISSIFFIKFNEKKQVVVDQSLEILAQIEDSKDQADQKIIIGDKENALLLLKDAQNTLYALQTNSDEANTKKQTLLDAIAQSLEDLQFMKTIEPTEVATLAIPFSQNAKIVLAENSLVIFDQQNKELSIFNITTNEITNISHETHPQLNIGSYAKANNSVIFFSTPNDIAQLDINKRVLSTREITYPAASALITASDVYNDKLYTYDATNQQIYKHNRTQTGFDRGESWITDTGLNLSDITDMAIDTSIYLMNTTGIIRKFNRGKEEPFALAYIEPKLEHAQALVTGPEHDLLFVLDKEQKRVILYDKTGGLIEQYTAKIWNNPSDIAVDPRKKIVYILDGVHLYSFPF